MVNKMANCSHVPIDVMIFMALNTLKSCEQLDEHGE
jgi:hypothetical protein